MQEQELIQRVVGEVIRKLSGSKSSGPDTDPMMIPVNASNRHVHLSQTDADRLFGPDYRFAHLKELSQPGQYAETETLVIAGPKGAISGVRILGPCRNLTQVEILASDQYTLGIKAPVRQSGDLKGSAPLTLIGPRASLQLKQGAIIAQRHIHLDPDRAQAMKLADKDLVSVEVTGCRPVTFREVLVRVNSAYAADMHIDIDEANACLIENGTLCKVMRKPTS